MTTLYTGNFPFITEHNNLATFLRSPLTKEQIAHYLPRKLPGDMNSLGSTFYGVNKEFATAESLWDYIAPASLLPRDLVALKPIIWDMMFAEKMLAHGKIAKIGLRIISDYTANASRVYNFHHDNRCRIICNYNTPATEWIAPSDADVAMDNPHIIDEYTAKKGAEIYTFPVGSLIRCNKRFVHRAPRNGGIRGVARFVLVVDYHQ